MGRWHFLDYSDVNLSLLARIGLCNRSLVGQMLFKSVSLLQRPITLPFVQITLFFLCNISYNSFRTEPTSGRTICANLSINCQDANIPASSALTWIFFCINFIQLLNQLLPLYKLHCISNGTSGLAVSAAICGGCYHRACSLSPALTLPGQISGGAGRFLLGLICPVRSPVPGRRASGHEKGGEVVRRRSSRHALDF